MILAASKIIFFILFAYNCLFSFGSSQADGLENCICWSELNSTTKEAILSLSEVPQLPPYTYVGVIDQTLKPCVCTDVLRLRSELTLEKTVGSNSSNEPLQEKEFIQIIKTIVLGGNPDFVDIVATFIRTRNNTSANESTWTIEAIIKGRQTLTASQVTNILKEKLNADAARNLLVNFGRPKTTEISFSVVQCTDDPPISPLNGMRNWVSAENYPPDRAIYECNNGYVFPDVSIAYAECSHFNQSWITNIANLTCVKGCTDDPPQAPFFSVQQWRNFSRTEGSLITYSCIRGYKSVTGKEGSSECQNSRWTDIEVDFECEQVLCPSTVPQVPVHGRADWDKNTRYIDTVITYSCMDGYSSTVPGTISSVCLTTGEWTILPQGFTCVNDDYAIRIGIYNDRHIRNYDYYEDGPQIKSKTPDSSWFWVVTIPSIIALVMTIFCCMVCTRTDSPLFLLCTGNTKNTDYISP